MKANVTERQWTIGRKPQPAEPTAMPVIVASEMGMRLTRSGPCSASSAGEGDGVGLHGHGRHSAPAKADGRLATTVTLGMGSPRRLRCREPVAEPEARR